MSDLDRMILLKTDRPILQIPDVELRAQKKEGTTSEHSMFDQMSNDTTCQCRARSFLLKTIPAISWLSKYNWKDDLIKDVVAGCTVAIMNIPQGMAYALLANIPPVVGIYMAFFPVLVYAFLGTSRHNSMGSFAVVCLMTGKIVLEHSTSLLTGNHKGLNNTSAADIAEVYTPIQVATAVSFAVGIFQVIMYLCRLGVICSLLSDTLVSGFTAGAAVQVFTSQIKDVFGLDIKSQSGIFNVVKTYITIFHNFSTINWTAAIISLITILILLINNTFIKSWVKKRSVLPVPIELIVVLVATIVSKNVGLFEHYDLKIVGEISVGIPEAQLPPISLVPKIATESLVVAIIAYIVSVSMALIFAQKNKYEIDPNQELLAQGAGNFVGSFFSCAPFAASLSRSVIQETVGGKTQLASLVSCGILLSVLLWIGPFFEPLPRCVLASLIIVALQSVLMQITKLPNIWKLSMLDGLVWITTYLTVIFVEIDVGLLVGLIVSILSLLIQGLRPHTCLLGRVPDTDIYVDKSKYNNTIDTPGVKIVRYQGGINFANLGYFKNEIYKLVKFHKVQDNKIYTIDAIKIQKIRYIVLDISGIHYVDPSGTKAIRLIVQELREMNIPFYMAGTSEPVYESFRRNGLIESNYFTFFPTVHDAVIYAQNILLPELNVESMRF